MPRAVEIRTFFLGCAVAGALTMVAAVLALASSGPQPRWVNVDNLSVVAEIWATACCWVAARRARGRLRWCWAAFGVMIALYVVGDSLWLALGAVSGHPPLLSVADASYLVGLLPGAAALVAYPATRGLRAALGPVLLDAAVLGSAVLLVSQVVVFNTVRHSGRTELEVFMLLAYPVTDVLLACLVLLLLLRSVGEARVDVVLLGLTFTSFAIADNGYAIAAVQGWDYSHSFVGLAYVVAPLCLGLAALSTGTFATGTRVLHRQLSGIWAPVLPDLTALAAFSLSLMWWRQGPGIVVPAAAVLVLSGLRQLVNTRQGQRWRLELEQRVRERTEEVALVTERHRQLEAMKYGFVTAVSHELRTPLTAIRGSLEMLHEGDAGELSPEAHHVVSVATRGTHRLSRLVDDIIDLERLQSGAFTFSFDRYDLSDLVVDAVESLEPIASAAQVQLVATQVHAMVNCDSDRVLQALVNLVGNAVKFTPPGGSVTLAAMADEDHVEVSVTDSGRGIPPDQLDAVFDRFHQVEAAADQAKGGTGLGLTITRHIVEAHGGRIWVESEVGSGARFCFTLPLSGGAAGAVCASRGHHATRPALAPLHASRPAAAPVAVRTAATPMAVSPTLEVPAPTGAHPEGLGGVAVA